MTDAKLQKIIEKSKYLKEKRCLYMKQTALRLDYDVLANMISESVHRVLMNESRSLKSNILYNLIKEKGNPYSDVDLHNVTDDDIIDVLSKDEARNIKKGNNIWFDDGTCVRIKYTSKDKDFNDKVKSRMNPSKYSRLNDRYDWHNEDAEEMIFKNPWFKEWPKEHQRKALDNVKNGRPYNHGF